MPLPDNSGYVVQKVAAFVLSLLSLKSPPAGRWEFLSVPDEAGSCCNIQENLLYRLI